ncbi:hypothetical protein KJ068_04770 [bacterium]|nr:hypothetical protein [bacterium]
MLAEKLGIVKLSQRAPPVLAEKLGIVKFSQRAMPAFTERLGFDKHNQRSQRRLIEAGVRCLSLSKAAY